MVTEGFVPKVCAIGPLPPVSSIIRLALKAGFFVGDSFGSGLVVIWLAMCYVSITRGWTLFLSRLTLAFFVSLIFSFFPYFGPMMSIGGLENSRCRLNEGGGQCEMYGGDVGRIAHDNVALGWQVSRGGPVAMGSFTLYVLFLLVAGYVLSRRSAQSA